MGKIMTHDVQHTPAHTLGADRCIGIQYGHSDEVYSRKTQCAPTKIVEELFE